jgi:hypothetical protein
MLFIFLHHIRCDEIAPIDMCSELGTSLADALGGVSAFRHIIAHDVAWVGDRR